MKKMVNISSKNSQVLDILQEIDKNKQSDYICRAIIEKYERDKMHGSDNLEDIIKKVMESVINPNLKPLEEVNKEEPVIVNNEPESEAVKEIDEKSSLIMDMFSAWDED